MKQDFNVSIDYRAFFLRPDLPPEGVERPARYNNPDSPVQQRAKEAGIIMNRPDRTPNTRLALEATEAAKQAGVGEAFHEEAYRSYWGEGVDLGKVENFKPIAEKVGMDWDVLSHHMEHRTYKDEVEKQYQEALHVGVTGIPAYVIGRFFFVGAQPYDVFKQVAERAIKLIEDGDEPEAQV